YSENPELQEVSIKLKDTKMLTVLLKSGPFCDSDKYSFSLALSTILDKIPANMREMLNSGDAMMMGASDMDTSSPAYIRRMYLQDFYRFFRICRYRSDFKNPFDYTSNTDAFFFANPIFANTRLQENALELCSFLSKRKMYRLLRLVLDTYQPKDNLEFALLEATLSLQENLHDAQDKFKAILNKTSDHEGALRGYAQASFNLGDFRAAEEAYHRLTILFPDNNRYMLNLSIYQINNNHVDEGVKILYRLDYEQPNNIYVQRALGWGLMMQKNIEQAIGLYDRLLASEHTIDSDYLNAGYAHWFNRNMAQAVACLGKYVSMRSREAQDDSDSLLAQAFDNDRSLLQLNGISAVESIIMQDIVLNPSKNDD
ncbi:MAG: tetratricopeptide repeat protein, partial [Prevotella sp.]|nr:tetratricopeptide repeat protein [Prevotella sp.]